MNCLRACLRPALIRGQDRNRICIVAAFKNHARGDVGWERLFKPPIRVVDGNDDFEDGDYELVLGAQTFRLTKSSGKYHEIAGSIAMAVK